MHFVVNFVHGSHVCKQTCINAMLLSHVHWSSHLLINEQYLQLNCTKEFNKSEIIWVVSKAISFNCNLLRNKYQNWSSWECICDVLCFPFLLSRKIIIFNNFVHMTSFILSACMLFSKSMKFNFNSNSERYEIV